MTTIVVSKTHGIIACDLQYSHSSGMKFKGATKVVKLKKEMSDFMFQSDLAYIGFCGNADTWGDIVSWFAYPEGKPPRCSGIEMLALTGRNLMYYGSNLKNWMAMDVPYFSVGSGMHFATAAMESGKTPKEAIRIASKLDPLTGFGVKEYKIS